MAYYSYTHDSNVTFWDAFLIADNESKTSVQLLVFNVWKLIQGLSIILLNGSLLTIFLYKKSYNRLRGAFALSLALADTVVGFEAVSNSGSYFSGTLYRLRVLHHVSFKLALYASVGTFIAWSAAQLRAVRNPLRARLWPLRNSVILLVGVWLIAIAFAVLGTVFKFTYKEKYYRDVKILELCLFVLCCIALCCVQCAIVYSLRKKPAELYSLDSAVNGSEKKLRKTTFMCMIAAAVFLCCFFPYVIIYILELTSGVKVLAKLYVNGILLTARCLIDPLLLGCRVSQVKSVMKKIRRYSVGKRKNSGFPLTSSGSRVGTGSEEAETSMGMP